MVLGQIFYRFTGSATQTHCARRPQLVSKKFLEEEIFAGTNFRELAFDRAGKSRKISRYTVCCRWIQYTEHGRYGLSCCRNCGVHELGLYGMLEYKLCCEMYCC